MKNNYHTHMYLCKHAKGTIEDYVKEAIKNNFDSIGFSDHAPFDFLEERSVRMGEEDYPLYLSQLDDAIKKYGEKIKIYKGLEIEYFRGMDNHYKKLLSELDYLTVGQHYIRKNGQLISSFKISSINELEIYGNTLVEAINSGYFKFVSHPDLFLINQHTISKPVLKICEKIILAAKEKNVPLEINANGIRRGLKNFGDKKRYLYPRQEFWKLVKLHNAKCLINADAHKPSLLSDNAIEEAYKFSKALGLKVEEELVMD